MIIIVIIIIIIIITIIISKITYQNVKMQYSLLYKEVQDMQ